MTDTQLKPPMRFNFLNAIRAKPVDIGKIKRKCKCKSYNASHRKKVEARKAQRMINQILSPHKDEFKYDLRLFDRKDTFIGFAKSNEEDLEVWTE